MTRLAAVLFLLFSAPAHADPPAIDIGSKSFTESVLLGEIIGHIARDAGATTTHHRQLGGTRILWQGLLSGEIDIYAEYTGTLSHEILAGEGITEEEGIRAALAERGIVMSRPLGFNNTYAIGMRPETVERLGIRTITDLARHPDLTLGFGNEFMERADGWPSLRDRYRLGHGDVTGLDHDLAYRALDSGQIDATDVYTTDAEIAHYGLAVLEDDLGHFPVYNAVLVYRRDLAARAPEVVARLHALEGRIDAAAMSALNARVKIAGVDDSEVSATFVRETLGTAAEAETETWLRRLWRNTLDHLGLVALSLGAAIVIALPLGILAQRNLRLGRAILAVVSIVQTIPSLAMFVFMIPLLGIGGPPAMTALFLYSLLPIVRNTHAGLSAISADLIESADAMGLTPGARLRMIELPLAAPAILAGIKTAAVINVGTATLGALIGAGGYGQPILTGIRLDDTALILQGAVPAAILALLVQALFELAERSLVAEGLTLTRDA